MLACKHSRANRLVDAFNLEHVEFAGGVADQHRTRHFKLRQRLVPASCDRTCAGRKDLTTFEQCFRARMVFELLECFERLETRVFVAQADDVTDVHTVLIEVIQKTAAVGFWIERPTERMLDAAGLHPTFRKLPQLFEAEAERRRIDAVAQIETSQQFFRD